MNVTVPYGVGGLNTTNEIGDPPRDVSRIVQICFTVILTIVMFGVGCAGDFTSIWSHFRQPAGICTGMFNQFIIMPLLALMFVYATRMPQVEAMAVLIQGTAPGGMMSNIFTYWMEGDINLSIAMTALNTLIAIGSMPLWLFLFTHLLNVEEQLRIPFSSLGLALVLMVFPVIFGMILRKFHPNAARILTKILTIFGVVAAIATIVVSGVVSELSFLTTWRQWLVAFLSPIAGILLGYITASLPFLKLDHKRRRTIAVETGMQNCQIAQSVLVISYAMNLSVYEKNRLYPLLSAIFQILFGATMSLVLARCIHVRKNSKNPPPADEDLARIQVNEEEPLADQDGSVARGL